MRGSAIITSKYDLTHTEPLEQSDQELQQFTAKEAEHFIYANEKKIDSATTNGNGRHCVFRSLFFSFFKFVSDVCSLSRRSKSPLLLFITLHISGCEKEMNINRCVGVASE